MDAVLGNMRSSFGNGVRKMFSNNIGMKNNTNSIEKSPTDLRMNKMSLCNICSTEQNTVPYIVRDICKFISTKSIKLEGIFRVSSSLRQINELREAYDVNTDYENDLLLNRPESTEVTGHAAAGLLKQFLRQLTEPLIPAEIMNIYRNCKSLSDELYAEKICTHMKSWPEPHRCTLLFLLPFLHMVAREIENRMSVNGLAVVFGPNVFKLPDGIEGLQAQGIANQAFERLLSCSSLLCKEFQESPRRESPPSRPSPSNFRPLPQAHTPTSPPARRPAPPVPTHNQTALLVDTSQDLMSFPQDDSIFECIDDVSADEEIHEETYDNVTLESSGEVMLDLDDARPDSNGKQKILDSSIRQIVQTRLFNSTESSSVSDETDSLKVTKATSPSTTTSPTVTTSTPMLLPSATAGRAKGPKNRRKPSRPKPLLNNVHFDEEDSEEESVNAATVSIPTAAPVTSIKPTPTSRTPALSAHSDNAPATTLSSLPASVTTVVTPDSGCIIEDADYPRNSSPIKAELALFEISERISPVDTFIPKLNLRSSLDEEEIVKVIASTPPPSDDLVPQLDLSSVVESDDFGKPKPLPRHHQPETTKQTNGFPYHHEQVPPRQDGTPPHPVPRHISPKQGTKKKKKRQNNAKKSAGKAPDSPEKGDNCDITETGREIMEMSRDRILTVLRENRRVAGRPFDVARMAEEELKGEKLSMQRELLKFEAKHGRPTTKESKQVMREVYDRYRVVKRALSRTQSGERQLDENENTIKTSPQRDLGDSFTITQKLPTDNITSCDESDFTVEGSDSTSDLLQQIHELRGKKKRLRRILRDFENERGPGLTLERRVMRSEYEQYKDVKNKLRNLEIVLAKKGVEVQ